MPAKRRGRPADQRSEDTRAAILDAAQRLFAEHGYLGASMERIAGECGLTVRAVYHYVPSKRALFDATAHRALERFGAGLPGTVFVHDGLVDRLHGYLELYRSLQREDPSLVPFLGTALVEWASPHDAPSADAGTEVTAAALGAFLAVLVDDGLARGELHPGTDRDGAIALLGAIGRGLSLAALDGSDTFGSMLDVLDRLIDGNLFVGLQQGAAQK